MVDRISTLRFRTDGAQAVTGSFEQISRKILAQQAMLERAQRVVSQKQAGAAKGITQTGLKEAQNQVISAEKQMNTMIADMEYASEHSRYEVKQRLLDRQLTETLKKVEGNEKAQLAIRKAYMLETAKLQNQMIADATKGGGAGAGGKGAHGRWQPGAYKTPQFGSMSDRFTAMFSIAAMMGNVTGDMTLARNVGVAASGFLLGSPLFGAINAGAIGISAAIRSVREETEKLTKTSKEYSMTLVEMTTAWSTLATDLVQYNPFGSKMEAQMKTSIDDVFKLRLEYAELNKKIPWMFGKKQRLESIDVKQSEISARAEEAGLARELRDIEFRKQIYEDLRMIHQRQAYAGLRMRQGESVEAYNIRVQEQNENLQFEFEYKQKIRQADAAITKSRQEMNSVSRSVLKAGLEEHELLEAKAKIEQARLKYQAAIEAKERIKEIRYLDRAKLDEKQSERENKYQEKYAKMIETQQIRSYESHIRATKDGYEQRAELREVAFAVEEMKAQEHGDKMVMLVKYMHEQMKAEEEKANRVRIENLMASFNAESALVQYRRQLKETVFGTTPDERKGIETELLIGRYNRNIESERLTLALKRNEVTRTEADIQSMMSKDIRSKWSGPEGDRIRQAITETANIRRSIREQDAYNRINDLLKRERERGSLSVGQFDTGKYYSGYVNFAALNQEGQFEELRQSKLLERIKEILERIELAGPLS